MTERGVGAATVCFVCGSAQLLEPEYFGAGTSLTEYWLRLVLKRARTFMMRDARESPLKIAVCVSCGHIEMRATDLGALREVYEERRK